MSVAAGPPLSQRSTAWSLKEALYDRAAKYHDRTAIVSAHQQHDVLFAITGSASLNPDVTWTYGQLAAGAEKLAAHLLKLGHRRNDRLVAIASNQAEWALLLWTALVLGSTFVPLSNSCTSIHQEVQAIFSVIGSATLFVRNAETVQALQNAAPDQLKQFGLTIVCSKEAPLGWISIHDVLSRECEELRVDSPNHGESHDIAQSNDPIMLFTSGTTSFPKAVTHSDEALFAGWSVGESQPPPENIAPRLCVPLPSNHGACLDDILLAWSGGGMIIFPSVAYSADETLNAIEKYRATRVMLVPTILRDLLNQPSLVKRDLSCLQLVACSGAALPRHLSKAIFDESAGLGARYMKNAWGMTEAKVVLTTIVTDPEAAGDANMARVGTPMPGAKVKICSFENQTVVRRDVAGELHVGGSSIARGYLNADSADFYQDDAGEQWLRTGDQAIMDDRGRVTITGRYKDIIIRGGENIVPSMIENVLDQVKGLTSQVVGYPDEMAGEVPVYVIKTRGGEPKSEELVALVRDSLGAMYMPKCILHLGKDLCLQNWPSTASGKPKKAELALHVKAYLRNLETRHDLSSPEIPQSDTIRIVRDIWSRISFIPTAALSDDTGSVVDFADSMILLQFTHILKKQTSISITMHELNSHRTIEQQARLLARKLVLEKPKEYQGQGDLTKPLATQRMPYIWSNERAVNLTKEAAQGILGPCNLSWDEDVDQVWPVYDCGAMMLRAQRPQSWNRRHAYVSTAASVPELRSALEKAITVHESFRTFAVHVPGPEEDARFDAHNYALEGGDLLTQGLSLHIAIKPTAKFFELIFKTGFEVDEPCDLANIFHGDSSLDFAAYPGPLAKFFLVNIRSTGTAGVVLLAQHSILDGVNTHSAFEDDLNQALGGVAHLTEHAKYKQWADLYFLHRNGPCAHRNARYFAERLKNAGEVIEGGKTWPRIRARSYFQGYFSSWRDNERHARPADERVPLDGDQRVAQDGKPTLITVQDLPFFTAKLGIHASTVMKAAIAIFNVRKTGNDWVILTSANASRTWAFEEDYSASERENLQEASDLAGATANFLPNRIDVPPRGNDGTTLSFLEDMKKLQNEEAENMQAPLSLVRKLLSPEDSKHFDTINRLQVFNWLPRGARFGLEYSDPRTPHMYPVQVMSRADLGVTWMGGQTDATTIAVKMVADNCQVSRKEMDDAVSEVTSLIKILGNAANTDLPLWDVVESGLRVNTPRESRVA